MGTLIDLLRVKQERQEEANFRAWVRSFFAPDDFIDYDALDRELRQGKPPAPSISRRPPPEDDSPAA
jgi:hypothetical protein